MRGCGLTVERMPIFPCGKVVIKDTEICPCFEPQVIRQTRMFPRRVKVLLRMRPQRYQAVDIWRQRAAFDVWGTKGSTAVVAGPVVIFHQYDKDMFYIAHLCLCLSRDGSSKKQRQHGYAERQDLPQMFHSTLHKVLF